MAAFLVQHDNEVLSRRANQFRQAAQQPLVKTFFAIAQRVARHRLREQVALCVPAVRLTEARQLGGLLDALADWWLAESEAHFHIGNDGDDARYVYDMPGMEDAPAVRSARAYLEGHR